jgi:hypothetical protein
LRLVKPKITTSVAALAVTAGMCGCGNTKHVSSSTRYAPAAATQSAQAPPVNQLDLASGNDQHQISATIAAFYRATWQGQGSAACSLFSATGVAGFMKAAKVAFPNSINPTTSCTQAMAFFHAGLADSVDTLQQSGVNVSGDILNHVGVKDIRVSAGTAAAEAPENVQVFIKPKRFLLVRQNGRWLIEGSQKIGKTLPQILATAKAKGELRPKHAKH